MEEKKRTFWSAIAAKVVLQDLPDELQPHVEQYKVEARRNNGNWWLRWKYRCALDSEWEYGYLKDFKAFMLEDLEGLNGAENR